MSKADACAAILWVGATLYAVFGGADFGAGFWSLVSGRSERDERARRLTASAIGPVWEANHVWLIFILVILWTAFSPAFEAVMSTLFIPLSLAAVGIVLRGAGFAFHEVVKRRSARDLTQYLFAASSVITPFFMGAVVGAIAAGEVPPGNAAGDPWSSWVNPVSILVGVLFVATGAYLAAVFLITDARHAGDEDLVGYFRIRALTAAVVTAAIAIAGIFVLQDDAEYVYDRLTAEALPLVIVSALCGLGAILLIWRRRRGARPLAVGAVVAVIWGWGVAQFPYLLPTSMSISDGAGTGPTLTMVIIVFGAAALLVLPAIGLLYTLTQRSMLAGDKER
jgi:cytochrome d ubiquinol oxidase subunit II